MGREKKYFFILAIFIIAVLASYFASAAATCSPVNGDPTHMGCVETKDKYYNTTTPIINVSFRETVEVNNDYVLYKIGELGEKYPLDPFNQIFIENLEEMSLQGADYKLERIPGTYSYRPVVHIPNGIYIFKVSAFNEPNVNIDVAVFFSINGTSMKFWVSSPTNDLVGPEDHPLFAFSNNSVFDIYLSTERPVEGCRFSNADIPAARPLQLAYQTDTSESFEYVNANSVALYEFDIRAFYPYNSYDGSPRKMSVICKESGSERYSFGIINIGVDQSYPSISVSTDFSPVVDYVQRRTNLTIRTDDASACTINKVYTQNYDTPEKISQMNNLPLINRNSSYDFTFYSEFVANYAELLIFSANPNPHNYTFNITCTNLANLKSSRIYIVPVALQTVQSFEFYSPSTDGYATARSITINGSVNIGSNDVTCNVSLNSSGPFSPLTRRNEAIGGRQIYSGTINVPADGTYTVYVTCKYMYNEFATRTVTVDTTPPTQPNVTGGENSCSLEDIEIKAVSGDTVSGVRRYYYNLTVNLAEKEFITGHSSSGDITISIDDLEEGKTYPISIWAEDRAGLRSPSVTKQVKVTNRSIPACDKNPPSIKINAVQNNATKAWAVTVNCTDKESGCRNSFSYGIETNTSKACRVNRTANLLPQTPIPLTTSAIFCATVYDNNNNNISDSITLTVSYPPGCSNNVKDGNETDLNCGGNCPKCAINKSCSANSDCSSNYCFNGKCATSSCTDKIKNGDEAGVDCGGSCLQKCGANSTNVTCTSDDDCITFNCLLGKCAAASCTNKKQDGNETGIDCGGGCPSGCPENSECMTHKDCTTGYCSSLSKKCEIDPSKDTDGDGLPDVWEKEHCGSITGCEPKKDNDEDKYSNKEEYEGKTDPNDPDDYPEGGRKISAISLILIILGSLMIMGGGTFKALNVMDEQKKQKLAQEKEMMGSLSQIPKIKSAETPAERELTEEEKLRGQQARLKALRERNAERKKMINQFDSNEQGLRPDASLKENSSSKDIFSEDTKQKVTEQEQKPLPSKKTKFLDEGVDEEYVNINELKDKSLPPEDPFSKLKKIADKSPKEKDAGKKESSGEGEFRKDSIKEEKGKEAQNKFQGNSKKHQGKASNEDVFEKLKKISKSSKK